MTPYQSPYQQFLTNKAIVAPVAGFSPSSMNPMMKPFQRDSTAWGCRRGRAALFKDCGLGKTFDELEWGRQVSEYTAMASTPGNVLHLTPLVVAEQTMAEAVKFGIPNVHLCRSQADVKPGINITNYEKLHKFDAGAFDGIVLDESSILKALDGATKKALIEFSQYIPYRLAATATPSPNDYTELGNHAEFLGVMSMSEMLATFFVHDGGKTSDWRLKGHAEKEFFRWLSTWAICMRKPSDLGYSDDGYDLPTLNIVEHILDCGPAEGFLFAMEARTMSERRSARRSSLKDRVAACAELVNASPEQWITWCDLNDESEMLHKLIPGSVEVKGKASASTAQEESRRDAFLGFIEGRYRVLDTKPKIGAWGLNLQNCRNMAFVGLSDSYEAFYQAVRRCWRFGQPLPVNVHVFIAETETRVLANIKRKEADADAMAQGMVEHMKDFNKRELASGVGRDTIAYQPSKSMALPEWMAA